jgi:hypothetical protein
MRIALDFDDTVTRDPDLWMTFVVRALGRGHDVRIVTFRNNDMDNADIDQWREGKIPVFYTGGVTKRLYCMTQGWFPHVWIDDMPEIIVEFNDLVKIPVNLIKLNNEPERFK